MPTPAVFLVNESDLPWVEQVLTDSWGSPHIASQGRLHDALELPGLKAVVNGERVGLLTYRIESDECEVISLDSLQNGIGVGTALIDSLLALARREGCWRVWLITTNDNLHALGFYQKRGFVLSAIHINAVEDSRRLKPSIPLLGQGGIPVRDEIELQMEISPLA